MKYMRITAEYTWDRLINKCTNCKWVQNNTNFGQGLIHLRYLFHSIHWVKRRVAIYWVFKICYGPRQPRDHWSNPGRGRGFFSFREHSEGLCDPTVCTGGGFVRILPRCWIFLPDTRISFVCIISLRTTSMFDSHRHGPSRRKAPVAPDRKRAELVALHVVIRLHRCVRHVCW